MRFLARLVSLAFLLHISAAQGMDKVRQITGAARVHREMGITGKGVLVAILDRGIDWANRDFRNPDGTTRIDSIWDPSSGKIEIYDRVQINEALKTGRMLPTRDAVGHGTTTAAIVAGNGFNSQARYAGIAPEATLIIAKITSDGAPAHDGQAAEQPFYQQALVLQAMDYVSQRAKKLSLPCVILLNIGTMGGPTDGTSAMCRKIDAMVGPDKPGMAFVTGPGDAGGRQNHAGGVVPKQGKIVIRFWKDSEKPINIDLWYPETDRLSVSVVRGGNVECKSSSEPPDNDGWFASKGKRCRYMHLGSKKLYFGAEQTKKREVWFTLAGPRGEYEIVLQGKQIESNPNGSKFDALLVSANPPDTITAPFHRFLNHVVTGSIWDGASAKHNICPGDFVFRTSYKDVTGVTRVLNREGAVGELWKGSSTGPTLDGRLGVHFCTPGNHIFTTYCPTSSWAQQRYAFNFVATGQDWIYGRASAVSASAPVATGIVALMLQADPSLDAIQIRETLCRTARKDRLTGEVPNPRWGFGKADAYQAVSAVRK